MHHQRPLYVSGGETFFEKDAMMKKALWPILLAIALGGNSAFGQSVSIRELYFNEFITFYVSSVDVATGATDVNIFAYELNSTEYPVWSQVDFKILINSIPLGLTYNTPFLSVLTDPFRLEGPVQIRNTDLDVNTEQIYYSSGPHAGEAVSFTIEELRTIFDEEGYNPDDLQSRIIQTGRLPDGTYRFSIVINAWEDVAGEMGGSIPGDEIDKSIVSSHPIALELISPGGPLEDTTNTAITTTYPFFQWQSDPCAICTYQVRVAEFKPREHSSMEDAIDDQTVLPLDQALGYYNVGNNTSFQYPMTGAVDLEPGHIYVWQVQKVLPTTEGEEFINSFIWAFQIIDPTRAEASGAAGAGVVVQGPILRFLQTAMGGENFDQAFEVGGELDGYHPNQLVRLNGVSINPAQLNDLNNALQQGTITIISVEVQ
ncbi:MAG: hypothetical protein ACETWG_01290 [Candidatus Neomarinimicrobiota bacterium]